MLFFIQFHFFTQIISSNSSRCKYILILWYCYQKLWQKPVIKKPLFIIPITCFSYAIINGSSSKALWYFSSTIFRITIWINDVRVTVCKELYKMFVSKANALCLDRLIAAIFPSVWYNLFINGVKSIKKNKLLRDFVHYVIQTFNLSEFVTCIKGIIIGKCVWISSNPQISS